MSVTSASITIQFDGSINTNNPNSTDFIPSVYPWQYDPNVENNWLNCIVDCDKWVLKNWRGFDFHVPAILYKNQVIGDAKNRLRKMYEDAQKKYKEELAAWMFNNMPKDPTKFQMSYPPTNGKSVTFTIATHGIANGSSSSSSFTNNNPKATVDISLTGANQSGAWSGNDNAHACNVLPWQLFYDGIGMGKWADPETYYEWEHNVFNKYRNLDYVGNYKVNGVPATNGDRPMGDAYSLDPYSTVLEPRWWDGTRFIPFYCYYDTRFNSDKYPNAYSMHDIRFNWDTIQAPTQTLAVNDLGRLYYIPDPIQPFPVPDYRVGRDVPIALPCLVNNATIYMHLAVGYYPPTGRSDARTSYKTGITFDITKNCFFHPEDKKHILGGRIEVKPFNFSDKLGKSFQDNPSFKSPSGDEIWGQNGLHTIEVINLGTEAAIEVYDPQQIVQNKTIRKYYDMQYYVPNFDQGEFLYRKKFAVVNPYPRDIQSAYMVIKYVKQYGHIGSKIVMDVVNPFNHDIILMHESSATSQSDFSKASIQQYINCILIPKTTGNNHNTVTITCYGYWDFVNFGMGFEYCLAPTKDYSFECDYGFIDNFSVSSFRSTGMANINWRTRDAIKADADTICKFPVFGLIWKTTAIQEPVHEIELPSIDEGGMANAFPTAYNVNFGMDSGQSCTADFYYMDNHQNKEICYAAGVKGQARLFTSDFHNNYAAASGKSSGLEAYISPDIDIVYHRPPNNSRYGYLTGNLHVIYPSFKRLFLGGAVATFCNKNDKLSTFSCEIDTQSEDHTTVSNRNIFSGTNFISTPIGSVFTSDIYGNPTPLNATTENNMLNTGDGVHVTINGNDTKLTKLWCKNIQLTGSTPPLLECEMVGRIVLGWDNTAIKVVTGNFFYRL